MTQTATDASVTRQVRNVGPWRTLTIRWPKTTDNWLKREARRLGMAPNELLRTQFLTQGYILIEGKPGATVTITPDASSPPLLSRDLSALEA